MKSGTLDSRLRGNDDPGGVSSRSHGRVGRAFSWLRWITVVLLLSLLILDFALPPLLPKTRDTSTLVVAMSTCQTR